MRFWCASAIVLWVSAVAAAGPMQGRSISGRVVAVDQTGATSPGSRAVVELAGGTLTGTRSLLADRDGSFVFRGLAPGCYTLTTTKPGFLPGRYGAPAGSTAPGTPIVLTDAADVEDVTIPLASGAVITGIVFDHDGQPMYGASVSLVRVPRTGARIAAPFMRLRTDDRGEYRFFGLPAGRYLVAALNSQTDLTGVQQTPESWFAVLTPRPGVAPIIPAGPPPVAKGYAATFAPGTPDIAAADVISVRIGEERTGVNIGIVWAHTANVAGTVQAPDGEVAKNVRVMTQSHAVTLGFRGPLSPGTRVGVRPDGSFRLTGLPPGRYHLEARGQAGDGAALWANSTIDINGADMSGVSLTLARGVHLPGRIVTAGGAPAEATGLRVKLTALDSGSITPEIVASADPSGAFVAEGLVPGDYALSLVEATAGPWRLQAVRVGGDTAGPGDDLRLMVPEAPLAEPVTLIVSRSPPSVRGTLTDAAGVPVSEFTVVLLSKDQRHWVPGSSRIRTTRPDANGLFEFSNVLPGDYVVGVIANTSVEELDDPVFLEALADAAVAVSVADGQTASVTLRVG